MTREVAGLVIADLMLPEAPRESSTGLVGKLPAMLPQNPRTVELMSIAGALCQRLLGVEIPSRMLTPPQQAGCRALTSLKEEFQ